MQIFKCPPNPKSCQAPHEGPFQTILGDVGSTFSDAMSFVGAGWCRTSGTAATCPVGTGPPMGEVSEVPSPVGWSWLLPSPVWRLRSDPQQSWAEPDTVAVQMVKWECFSRFCKSFEEFVNYFLACCFGREIKISSHWQQACKRNQKSGKPQYFIFDFVFIRFCLLLQKPRNQSTCRIKVFLMNKKEKKFLLSSISYKWLKLSAKKH